MLRSRTALGLLLFPLLLFSLAALAESPAAEPGDTPVLQAPPRLAVAGIRRPASPPPEALAVEVANAEESDDLNAMYNVAIFDSAIFRASRQDANLDPAHLDNLQATSFVSCYRCDECNQCPDHSCDACSTCSAVCRVQGKVPAPSDIWISQIPQLQAFCRELPMQDVILRLQQFLGLPPVLDQPFESWRLLDFTLLETDKLFRPCTDPDPTTTGPCTETFPASASETHRAWIAGQAFSAWQIPNGYPWTRQGYTYNWNPADSLVGGSEYVVPAGALVEIRGVDLVSRYCGAETP